MLFSVNAHDPVLMAVSMHRGKLIEVLRTAVRAHPGHADGDGSAQTFLVRGPWVPFLLNGLSPSGWRRSALERPTRRTRPSARAASAGHARSFRPLQPPSRTTCAVGQAAHDRVRRSS